MLWLLWLNGKRFFTASRALVAELIPVCPRLIPWCSFSQGAIPLVAVLFHFAHPSLLPYVHALVPMRPPCEMGMGLPLTFTLVALWSLTKCCWAVCALGQRGNSLARSTGTAGPNVRANFSCAFMHRVSWVD